MNYALIEASRKRLKVRKSALAKSTGIPARRIGQILAGTSNPRISDLEAICGEVGLLVVLVLK